MRSIAPSRRGGDSYPELLRPTGTGIVRLQRAHDLRAPLRAIDGFSQLFAARYHGAIDAAGHDYLSRVRNAAKRMDELIDALLKMSRLTRGELKIVALDLSTMAGDVVMGLRASQPERRVRVDIAPRLQASGDAALIRNLLENLLGNAWKFTEGAADPHIEFAATGSAESGFKAFYVRDNGAGFAASTTALFRRSTAYQEHSAHGRPGSSNADRTAMAAASVPKARSERAQRSYLPADKPGDKFRRPFGGHRPLLVARQIGSSPPRDCRENACPCHANSIVTLCLSVQPVAQRIAARWMRRQIVVSRGAAAVCGPRSSATTG